MLARQLLLITVQESAQSNMHSKSFHVDGNKATDLVVVSGRTYKFDQTDPSNKHFQLCLLHEGRPFTKDVTVVSEPGSAGSGLILKVTADTPSSLTYCTTNNSTMGARIIVLDSEFYDRLTVESCNIKNLSINGSPVPQPSNGILECIGNKFQWSNVKNDLTCSYSSGKLTIESRGVKQDVDLPTTNQKFNNGSTSFTGKLAAGEFSSKQIESATLSTGALILNGHSIPKPTKGTLNYNNMSGLHWGEHKLKTESLIWASHVFDLSYTDSIECKRINGQLKVKCVSDTESNSQLLPAGPDTAPGYELDSSNNMCAQMNTGCSLHHHEGASLNQWAIVCVSKRLNGTCTDDHGVTLLGDGCSLNVFDSIGFDQATTNDTIKIPWLYDNINWNACCLTYESHNDKGLLIQHTINGMSEPTEINNFTWHSMTIHNGIGLLGKVMILHYVPEPNEIQELLQALDSSWNKNKGQCMATGSVELDNVSAGSARKHIAQQLQTDPNNVTIAYMCD